MNCICKVGRRLVKTGPVPDCRKKGPGARRCVGIVDFGLASSDDGEYISTPHGFLSFGHFVSIPPSGV